MRRAAIGLLVGLAVASCRSADAPVGPYTAPSEAARDTAKAEKLNREAADLLATDPARAEEMLRQALTADLFHGPAHNNLGVVYLGQQKLYEAAGEFEWAKKLMPGHPDPRVNLGLVMEAAGRNDEAMASYEAALEVWPGYLPAIQGAASLALRSGKRDDARLSGWLDEVALRGDEGWREWARSRATRHSTE
jgi:Tfp pilus assembly protein PilF